MIASKPAAAAPTTVQAEAGRRRRQGRVAQVVERFALLAAWVGVIVFFSLLRPDAYPTWGNFSTILGSQAVQPEH